MGAKTRSNYCIPFCTKADCTNRGALCSLCIMYCNYVQPRKLEVLKDDPPRDENKR